MFVLGSLETKTGKVWRKNFNDMCYVELTEVFGNVNLFTLYNIIMYIY